jgi:nicotinamide mononucleotide (NMN) deamidase PncC
VIAVLAPGRDGYVRTFNFLGARAQVKYQATQAVLDRVRRLVQ